MHCCNEITRFLAFYFIIILAEPAPGQEMLGIVNSNYTGVLSSMINPANTGSSCQQISVNILGGDIFELSDYLYVHKQDWSFFGLFSVKMNDPKYMYIYDYPSYNYIDTVHYLDYFKNDRPRNLYFDTRIAGPSLLVHFGNHAFSLITGFRNNVSMQKIPNDAANFIFRGQDFEPQHNITYDDGYFTYAALSWIEMGLGYTYTFLKDKKNELNAGIMLKGLLGTGASYGIVENVSYMVPNTDSIYFYRMNATMALDLPLNYADNTPDFNPLIRGYGFGIDAGLTWSVSGNTLLGTGTSAKKIQQADEQYLYRAGVSMLDIGMINYNREAQVHQFSGIDSVLWSGLLNFHATSLQQFIRSASYHLLGDSLASLTGISKFRIWLPTAVSLQFDYNFGKNFFVSGTFVQPVKLGTPSIRRPSLIAITPRYGTRAYEVSLPFSLVDYRQPQVGLALRIYSIVVGTEKLGTFLTLTDVDGMDFYFSIGFNLNQKSGAWKNKHGKSAGCDAFDNYQRYRVR